MSFNALVATWYIKTKDTIHCRYFEHLGSLENISVFKLMVNLYISKA